VIYESKLKHFEYGGGLLGIPLGIHYHRGYPGPPRTPYEYDLGVYHMILLGNPWGSVYPRVYRTTGPRTGFFSTEMINSSFQIMPEFFLKSSVPTTLSMV